MEQITFYETNTKAFKHPMWPTCPECYKTCANFQSNDYYPGTKVKRCAELLKPGFDFICILDNNQWFSWCGNYAEKDDVATPGKK